MIIAMITVGIIVTSMTRIIRQEMVEMTGGHTKVTNIMMIEGGMKTIDVTIMIKGMTIENLKDLNSFNVIRRVEIIPNHRMLGRQHMRREKLVDQTCQIAILAGRMVTM